MVGGSSERRHHPISQLWVDDVLLDQIGNLFCKDSIVNRVAITGSECYFQFLFSLVSDELPADIFRTGIDLKAQL